MKYLRIIGTVVLVVLAGVLGVLAAQHYLQPTDPIGQATVPANGQATDKKLNLTQNGKTTTLADFQGKLVLIYFGYASCPDVCPTALGLLGSALKELTPAEIAQIQPLFISVDPERDHGEKLLAYARYFHPSFLGLTGTPKEIQQAAAQFGAFYAKVNSDSAMGYLVDHTSNTYLLGKNGKLLKTLPHDMSKTDVINSLRAALSPAQ